MDQLPKRRRIIVQDEEDFPDENSVNSVDSNPDNHLDDQPSSDEEGEDLMENWMADYAPAPELDQYDSAMLTDEVIVESFAEQMRYRRLADEALDAEDERRRRMDEEAEDNLEGLNEIEDEEIMADDEDDDEDEEEEGGGLLARPLNLEAFDCPLREWITEERTRQEVMRRFRRFLHKYYVGIDKIMKFEKKNGPEVPLPPDMKKAQPIYPSKIRTMAYQNKVSLEVSYHHLSEMQPLLAMWLEEIPRDLLLIFDDVLRQAVFDRYSSYMRIKKVFFVRIIDYPVEDRLRDLRQIHLNRLIRVVGVVTRRTGVYPKMTSISYDCLNCNQTIGPFRGLELTTRPSRCVSCNANNSFKINLQKTEYGNYQKITLQETPGSVPPGRVPRYKDVVLLNDLIDIARPGEEVEVLGIYTHQSNNQIFTRKESKNGFPVFSTIIDAISVLKRQHGSSTGLTDEEIKELKILATDTEIRERIIRSMAPSIYGHRHVKTAIALSLFGGCAKENGGSHRVRGDINVLLLGDPGTAKSQILKYCEKTAPRSVYSTGKGASAVGLTAGVRRDPLTKEWTLEGGALVLADQGVCLIDEFDKMNEQDRTSIHEAMEQQTISVSKAGIVTSLQARCAVLAAANPIGGRYDASYTLAENVELTDPILQRFDILCVLQDIVNPVIDEQLALFVATSHMKSHPDADINDDDLDDNDNDTNDVIKGDNNGQHQSKENVNNSNIRNTVLAADDPMNISILNASMVHTNGTGTNTSVGKKEMKPLDQEMLKKYILYARTCVHPTIRDIDSEKIASLYSELRKQSAMSGGVPIAVRHLESVMRMSEASARMHLRDHVRDDDIDLAIKVMLESFLQAQKVSIRKMLQKSFRKYISFGEENDQLLMHQLQGLVAREEKYHRIKYGQVGNSVEVAMDELEAKARELNIYDLRPFYTCNLFQKLGFYVDNNLQVIVKQY